MACYYPSHATRMTIARKSWFLMTHFTLLLSITLSVTVHILNYAINAISQSYSIYAQYYDPHSKGSMQFTMQFTIIQSTPSLNRVAFIQNTTILIPKDLYHLHATHQFMQIISIYPFIPVISIYELGHVNTCLQDPSPRGSITFNTFFQFMHFMLY
jgi:hypothetical protein